MHTRIFSAGIVLMLFSTASYAATSTEEFVRKVALGNTFEIETSELALDRSGDEGIKAFAQKIIDDHERADDNLEKAVEVSEANIDIDDDLDTKHETLYEELKDISPLRFDDRYLEIQRTAHKETVALFADYAANGDNAQIQQFAKDTLPTLRQHLAHAEKLK